MKVEVREIEELVRELNVEIPAETVKDKMERMFADVRRGATLKGFRKGKAPMALIKSKFGDEVKADVADQLIQSSYPKAIEDKQLKVASRPTLTHRHFDDEGVFKYTAQVEVLPGVDRVESDDLQITKIDIEVKDEDIESAAQSIRMMFAEFRPVDREVRNDDLVTVDLRKVHDPSLVLDTDLLSGVEIDLARGFTLREFREQLPGMKAGDEKEIEVVYDDDYPDPAYAGAHITYNCHVKSVQERILPEFDDALAKRTGKAQTALELRMKLRQDLQRQQAERLRSLHKSQVIRQVCQKNAIPIPPSMITEYLDAIVAEEKERYPNVDEKEIRNNSRDVAVNTLRWNILYHHLAEQEKIEVSPSDTEQMVRRLADDYKTTFEQAKQTLERSGKISSIRDTILEQKVLDFLIGKAKLVVDKTSEVS